jgi:hypothetical protein
MEGRGREKDCRVTSSVMTASVETVEEVGEIRDTL